MIFTSLMCIVQQGTLLTRKKTYFRKETYFLRVWTLDKAHWCIMEVPYTIKEASEEKTKEPCSRKGHMAVKVPGQIVLFDGEDIVTENINGTVHHITVNMISMREIWVYHLDIDRWLKTALPETHVVPPPTACACAVVIGSQIYMHGGAILVELAKPKITGALWKLTNTAEVITWSEMKFRNKKSIPSPRLAHAGWEYEDKLWIFGGWGLRPENYMFNDDSEDSNDNNDDDNGKISNNQLACYNLNNHEWKIVQVWGAAPSPRESHAVAKIKDHIWLYGGRVKNEIYDDLYELNMESLTWTLIEPVSELTHSARSGHTFTAISDLEIALYGGATVNDDTSLWLLDLESLSWKQSDASLSDHIDDYSRERHTATMGY